MKTPVLYGIISILAISLIVSIFWGHGESRKYLDQKYVTSQVFEQMNTIATDTYYAICRPDLYNYPEEQHTMRLLTENCNNSNISTTNRIAQIKQKYLDKWPPT